MEFNFKKNTINFIRNESNFTYPKYVYKLVLHYDNFIFFSRNKSYMIDIDDIFAMKNKQGYFSADFDIFEFLELQIGMDFIIFDNMHLNRFEEEMVRAYCEKYRSTALVFLKSPSHHDFILKYENNKFIIS